MNKTEKRPVYPIHPGTILADELQELNMSAAELARQLHVPSNRIDQLISGKRDMTAVTVLRLEQTVARRRGCLLDEPGEQERA